MALATTSALERPFFVQARTYGEMAALIMATKAFAEFARQKRIPDMIKDAQTILDQVIAYAERELTDSEKCDDPTCEACHSDNVIGLPASLTRKPNDKLN